MNRDRPGLTTAFRTFLAGLVVALGASSTPARADFFADFATIDPVTETATGQLNGIAFTLTSTRAAARPIVGDNGGIVGGGVTNGTFAGFNSPYFTPGLVAGDAVVLGGASDFKLAFASAVTNLTLHVRQLESNTLSFTSGGNPIAFNLASDDGHFTVFPGNTSTQGSPGTGSDANGSLFFAGTYTELSWTAAIPAAVNTLNDGYWLQFSVAPVPEPSSVAMAGCGILGVLCLARRRRRTAA